MQKPTAERLNGKKITSSARILVSNTDSPAEGVRGPWGHGGFQGWDRK